MKKIIKKPGKEIFRQLQTVQAGRAKTPSQRESVRRAEMGSGGRRTRDQS